MAANQQPVNRTTTTTGTTYSRPTVYDYDATMMITPTDRVRWGPILAGLFTVLATLVFFTLLGLALGLETFNADDPRSFGIGAGIYGIIAGLISFALGGFIAAKTAAVTGVGNAILQSGMVWIVTIALIVNFIGTGIGTLLNVAGSAVTTAADVASNVAGDAAGAVASDPNLQATAQTGVEGAAPELQATAAALPGEVQGALEDVSPQEVEQAADNVADAAWWALLGLGVTAAAALGGGLMGTRRNPVDIAADPRISTN
ncbi:MAG: hypothetical protein J0M07_04140 [Anaerolineae bacterium]|nr:hypothetical protein [Anaerolineae bacterium]